MAVIRKFWVSAAAVGVLFPVAAQADIVISASSTQNVSCQGNVCVPLAPDAVLNVVDLENLLAGGGVEVTTTGSGVQAVNIRLETPLSWSSSGGLTLDAYQSIRVEKPMTIMGAGALSIEPNDGGSNGALWFSPKGNISFAQTSNSLSIAGIAYTLISTLPELAASVAANPAGDYALAADYDAKRDGTYHASPITSAFAGGFNGLGNAITGMRIKSRGRAQEQSLGLFEETTSIATISSVKLTNISIGSEKPLQDGPFVGGLVAASYGTIFNSSVQGNIQLQFQKGGGVGGIAGVNVGSMYGANSNVQVGASSDKLVGLEAGGLAGQNDGKIAESFSTGSASTITSEGSMVGALVGWNVGDLENCYATGASADSGDGYVGGLIGVNIQTVSYSYSTGMPVAGANGYIGGLIGYDVSDQGSLHDTYWDMTTSGASQGAGNVVNDQGIKGETTSQLQKKLPKGFDPGVWALSKKINNGLPYLINNPPQ
ncbi:MAG TPA: GLUG motif-containing protein [Rhizomicrobium sp.]